jgi:DNA-binding transcriptional LysR family regulator
MTRLTLEALELLDAIDRRGSFAGAADELHRVPSAITYSVRQLEDALGVQVFDRRGHRAALTAAGAELLAEGRRLLHAAAELECRVQQVARGWESELRIAADALVPIERLLELVAAFYGENSGTRVRLSQEILAGTWDALVSGRADLAIGAAGEAPPGRSYPTRALGAVPMEFVAAPAHPICNEREPLSDEAILAHRAITVADTSRMLPARTAGVLSGQDVLTVPTLDAKVAAHVAGLGVGFLPRALARREAAAGRLRILAVEHPRAPVDLVAAWRSGASGKALRWFARRLEDPAVAAALVA